MTTNDSLRTVSTPEGDSLQYEVAGQGPPIVCLTGSFVGRDTFNRQRAALADEFRLILRDLRGHNGSAWREPAGYGLDTTELDDIDRVLDAESVEQAHLIGHSTGGAIAFAYAQHRPDRVGKVVLIEASLFNLLPDEPRHRLRADLGALAEMAEQGDPVAAARGVFTYILGHGWETRAQPTLVEQVEQAAPTAAAHIRALLALPVTPDDIRALGPRALYLYGDRSIYAYTGIYQRIAEIESAAPKRFVDRAGHALYLQKADEVNPLIRDFFSSP